MQKNLRVIYTHFKKGRNFLWNIIASNTDKCEIAKGMGSPTFYSTYAINTCGCGFSSDNEGDGDDHDGGGGNVGCDVCGVSDDDVCEVCVVLVMMMFVRFVMFVWC